MKLSGHMNRHVRRRKEPPILCLATHPQHFVSTATAAAYLGIAEFTLNRRIRRGTFPATTINGKRKIAITDLWDQTRKAARQD